MPLLPEMLDLADNGNWGGGGGGNPDTWFGPSMLATLHGARGCFLLMLLSAQLLFLRYV